VLRELLSPERAATIRYAQERDASIRDGARLHHHLSHTGGTAASNQKF